jgi:putative MATE family efflux protein
MYLTLVKIRLKLYELYGDVFIMIKDLTKGSPSKTLFMYSIPLLLSAAFQQFYNMADSIIAGKFAGTKALAAVGASYPITMIIIAVAVGLNTGCSVVISQFFGSKKIKRLRTGIYTSLIAAVIISAVMILVCFETSKFALKVLNTPQDIFSDALTYLNIYIFGVFFLVIYNISNGIFAALGDSKTPLYFLICSSLGNIFLDMLFVINFKMGVAGVAWATFIAQGIAALFAFVVLMRRIRIFGTEKVPVFSFTMLRNLSYVAIPSILQQSLVSVGNLFIQAMVNSFGADVIAAYSSAIRINTFALVSMNTISGGISSFSAQNYGAGKNERIHGGFKAALKMMSAFSVAVSILCFVFSRGLIGMFVESGEINVINIGSMFLKIIVPFYIFVDAKILCDGVLRGTEKMMAFMISTFTDLILRVIISFILMRFFGETGIWLSWPIGWVIGTGVSFIFYKLQVMPIVRKGVSVEI